MLTAPHSHIGSANYNLIGNTAASHTYGQRMQRVRQQANPNALVTSTRFAGAHPVGGLQSLAFTFLGGMAAGYAVGTTDPNAMLRVATIGGAGLVGERATSEIYNGFAAALGAFVGLSMLFKTTSKRKRSKKDWSQALF